MRSQETMLDPKWRAARSRISCYARSRSPAGPLRAGARLHLVGNVEEIDAVGRTAIGVAYARARESCRLDRLFADPLALSFVFAAGREGVIGRDGSRTANDLTGRTGSAALGARLSSHIVVRTRFYDDYLLQASAGGCRQVVLLAAGLDTRAFRLAWPDRVTVFEVDQAGVLAFKERVLAEEHAESMCAKRVAVAADLRLDWARALSDAGFDPAAKTAWLIEGLLIYLSQQDAEALLHKVSALSVPGSQVSFEDGTVDRATLDRIQNDPASHTYTFTTLWKGGLGKGGGIAWLSANGWHVQSHERAALAQGYGRPLSGDEIDTGGFITARRD
jgi:methyltransferase (TIGR00027 family)